MNEVSESVMLDISVEADTLLNVVVDVGDTDDLASAGLGGWLAQAV